MNKDSLSVTTPTIEPCHRINQIDNDPVQRRALEEVGARGTVTLQDAPGCSTAVVRLLDKQLIEEMNKIEPNCLVSFADLDVELGEGVHPFLQLPAKEALAHAISERGQKLAINSAYRTIAQQLFLFTRGSSCSYDRVAPPGSSNHESGLALDIVDPEGWSSFLENYGWCWPAYANDLCHFEYRENDKKDIGGTAVLAFQKLWNRYNPNEQIDEEGVFGPATEEKLNKSPVEGF
jgi:N-acetylmuramoyl-L-alanine amidase